MKRMLFNATQAEELRVAIVDGQNLLDLDIETVGKEQRKGNIYKGIITRIEPSLEACFVDYGTDRHGFLPFKEVSRAYFQDYEGGRARIQDVLCEGMQLIVQVEKDERGNKGAALTTFISLAGRYLVLMPNNPRGGGVSRRIEGDERAELKAVMAQLEVPAGMSLIARTAGIGRSVEELQWDYNYLLQLWQNIEAAGRAHQEPYLLFMESSLVIRAIRDYYRPDIGEVLIDNQEVFEQVHEFMSYVMPSNVGKLKHYTDHIPLFSRFQIENQIESAFSRSVSLPSGGAIVIDHTEALVSIDVNSARATRGADIEDTAFKTNMEAAEEVARQMRLRDLGGLIVIDFIDMENPKNQRDVENVLRDALKKDRARIQIGKLSRFGLLELSRQRLKPSLGESSHTACPRCAGTGFIRGIESTALHVLRIIQEEAMKQGTEEVHAQVPVDVATFLLNEKRAELFGLEERLDVSILMIPNPHLENPHYTVRRLRSDGLDEETVPSYKRVAEPETEETDTLTGRDSKPVKPVPAVTGVKHSQPAPVVEKAEKGLWAKICAWFSGLGGKEEPAKPEKPAASNASGGRHPAGKRLPRQQRHGRKPQNFAADASTPQAEQDNKPRVNEREQSNRSNEPRNNDHNRPNKNRRVAQRHEGDNASAPQNHRARAPRKEETAVADVALTANQPAALQVADVPAEVPVSNNDSSKRGERRERNDRPPRGAQGQERKNHQSGKNGKHRQRNIPSALKIIHYLDVGMQADLVRQSVAAVLANDATSPLQVASEVVPAPVVITLPAMTDAPETTAAPAFTFAPEALSESPDTHVSATTANGSETTANEGTIADDIAQDQAPAQSDIVEPTPEQVPVAPAVDVASTNEDAPSVSATSFAADSTPAETEPVTLVVTTSAMEASAQEEMAAQTDAPVTVSENPDMTTANTDVVTTTTVAASPAVVSLASTPDTPPAAASNTTRSSWACAEFIDRQQQTTPVDTSPAVDAAAAALVLVETRPELLRALEPEVLPVKGLRRSDVPALVVQNIADEPMQQIETQV